jgi:hypothetical protein
MINLTNKESEAIKDIIKEYTIIEVTKNEKPIWDCTGLETKYSQKNNIQANIKNVALEYIIPEILAILIDKYGKEIQDSRSSF